MVLIKGYDVDNFNCSKIDSNLSFEQLISKDIESFRLNTELIIGDKTFIFVDKENPIMYMSNFFFDKTLIIDKDFMENNKETVFSTLISYIKNMKSEKIKIEDLELINDEVLKAIIENSNIKKVKLGNKENIFFLNSKLYEEFKKANKEEIITDGVTEELKDNFDSIIAYNNTKTLVADYSYDNLVNSSSIIIKSKLSHEELENLKYISNTAEVIIYFEKCENVFQIINKLRELNFSNSVEVRIENKNTFNRYLFENINNLIDTSNIKVNEEGKIDSFETYYVNERKLVELVKPAFDLSPFEKYLYVYDLVNKYKKYKENKDDKSMSRDLYKLLDSEYMVCVGYSKLLKDLLLKLGIEAYEYLVTVDIGLDDVPIDTRVMPNFISGGNPSNTHEVLTNGAGHVRLFVNLVDPKYEINGYYIADPTWDNDMENHAFNYALMTHDEFNSTDRYNYMNIYGVQELFFVHSLEEFYYKLNVLLDKNPNKSVKDYVSSLVMYFKDTDMLFYQELMSKYEFLNSYLSKSSRDDIQNVLLNIGEHILTKTNNLVDGEKFKNGITSLYENGVWQLKDEENIEDEVNKIMEYNKKRHEFCFPIRYMIDRNGVEIVMMNAVNKFDIEAKKVSKI